MTPHLDAVALLPEIILTATLAIVFVIDVFIDDRRRPIVTALGGIGVAAALVATIGLGVNDRTASMVGGSYEVDTFSLAAKGILLASALVVLLFGAPRAWKGEYVVLLLSSLLGMVLIASARDLIIFFIAFELLAIPGYMLVGWNKRQSAGNEAALKYFLLGVLATAVMLYGLSLIFGIANGTSFNDVALAMTHGEDEIALVRIAVFFVLVGMAFKVSAVPFHFWAPDAYQGAPVPVAAFLSVASKAAGFIGMLTLVLLAFPDADAAWAPLLYVLAIVTMTAGNLLALKQHDVIRLLAYSSIAQAGYLLVPLAVTGRYGGTADLAIESTLSYLVIYAAMNLGAFAVAFAIIQRTGSSDYAASRGLFYTAPVLAVAFAGFLLSLAGIPPFGGWFAKLVIFRSAIEADSAPAVVLAIFVAVNTAIGLFYYASLVRNLWLERSPEFADDPSVETRSLSPSLATAVAITAAVVIVTGVLPNVVSELGGWSSLAR